MTYYYMGDATSFNPFQALTFLILITTPFILGDDGTAATSSSPVISTGPYSYSDPFNLSMGVILAVLITTFCLTFLFLIYIKHCYDTNTNTLKLTTNSRPSHVRKNSGIDRDVLESLPVFRFGSLRGQKNGLDCAVCVARFEDPEVLRLLPKCKHAFHVARRILHVPALPLQGRAGRRRCFRERRRRQSEISRGRIGRRSKEAKTTSSREQRPRRLRWTVRNTVFAPTCAEHKIFSLRLEITDVVVFFNIQE
ncbi:putative RING-H2 finger protein ATL12 [Glycine max]|nr:hypothetical protein JHK87_004823 [Glycine soja]KAG5063982.1 hypothetical protein JHK85_005165 [Glycine max]KAH1262790.1 putative RING-H2 finger protein ATL12 [Glycine max]